MAYPRIIVRDRELILLSGFECRADNESVHDEAVVILARDELVKSARRNPEAVAFGFTAGQWVAAA